MAITETSNTSEQPAVVGMNTVKGDGVWGQCTNGRGVVGVSGGGAGVWGHTINGRGMVGVNNEEGVGVWGVTKKGRGVVAIVETDGDGAWGETNRGRGVVGISKEEGTGVWGVTKKGRGVVAIVETDGDGAWGETKRGRGVVGISKEEGTGVWGVTKKGRGVVAIVETDGDGAWGETNRGRGVVGISKEEGTGVWGETKKGSGVVGISQQDIGVFGKGGQFAAFFEGDVHVTGDINCPNADCAEHFDVSGEDKAEPGTVMVLGNEGALFQSQQAYDKRVAGVISGAGDYKPGIVLDKRQSQGNRQPISLMGKVFCKVDAQFGAIEVGDLLTTSSTPGHAMKVGEPLQAFGAVIGKALRPLTEGQGLIPILIALQ